MRVLIVLHRQKKRGGAVLQLLKLASNMRKMGNKVFIFSLDRHWGKSRNKFLDIVIMIRTLRKIIEEKVIDVILTSDPYFTTPSVMIANIGKKKSIYVRIGAVFDSFYAARISERILGHGSRYPVFDILKLLLKQVSIPILRKVDLIIFNSFFLYKKYAFLSNSTVIHNGVEVYPNIKIGDVSDVLNLVFVGRIEPRKSIELIIDALILLEKTGLNFKFTMIGNTGFMPKYWKKIKKKITKAKLWGKISFSGEIDNKLLPSYLRKHDILIFSTDTQNFPMTESFPNVILEAMANGLAIVATNVAGVPEIISNENGMVIDPEPSKIADAIQVLSKDKEKLKKIKINNIKKVRNNFDIVNITKKYLRTFSQEG